MMISKICVVAVATAAMLVLGSLGCDRGEPDKAKHTETDSEAFCEEHQIAEAQCPFCDPTLIESLGFCNGHGVPEAYCYQCNPALVPAFKAAGDWCAGHDRPESQCYICNPELDPARKPDPTPESSAASTAAGVTFAGATASEYLPRTQRTPSVSCATQALVVRFDTPAIAREAGLEFATVRSRPITRTLECNAIVAYDGNRYAHLAAQLPGIVATVHKNLGERVEPGDALATITTAHLGAAKAAYLQALAVIRLRERNHERERDLFSRGVSSERQLLEAETQLAESRIALAEAEQALISLGLSDQQIETVGASGDTSARYVVTASFPGIIVERHAVVGEVVDSSKPLFAVADVSRMWALLDVYESDAREIRVGQPVVLRVDGLAGEPFGGYITWISSEVDPQTRTVRARAEIDNGLGTLRANMFAHAVVATRDRQQALVVQETSVQWEGCCNVVFVKKSDMVYEPRKVHLGTSTGAVYEVLDGLDPDEVVVTQGSFLLKTEILKGSIGAGCCEVQPGA